MKKKKLRIKVLSKKEAIKAEAKLFEKGGVFSNKIKRENKRIAHIQTRPTTPIPPHELGG